MLFNTLPEDQRGRVVALADALADGDCLPLVRYMGDDAGRYYDRLTAAIEARPVLASEYLALFMRHAFIRDFIRGG